MRKRFLTVPLNEIGIQEYDVGVEKSENMHVYNLPESEFIILSACGIFDEIDKICGTLIDDYESEIIKNNLDECINIVFDEREKVQVFYKALVEAMNANTFLALDF